MSTGDTLYTVEQAAERLNTSARFVRRLIAERRITFVKLGRHVRITESGIAEFVRAGTIEPMSLDRMRRRVVA